MKNIIFILLLICLKSGAQDTITLRKVDAFKRNIIEFSADIPQDNLANKYTNSINFGIWFRNKINRNQYLDNGIELSFLQNNRNVIYNYNSAQVTLNGNHFALHLGLRFIKEIPLDNKRKWLIELESGAGWSSLYYKKPVDWDTENNNFDSNLHTIHLSQGFKVRYKSVGVFVKYRLTPYTLFYKRHETNFGESSINFGISKGFNF